jgi:hypothetical protein
MKNGKLLLVFGCQPMNVERTVELENHQNNTRIIAIIHSIKNHQ